MTLDDTGVDIRHRTREACRIANQTTGGIATPAASSWRPEEATDETDRPELAWLTGPRRRS